MMSVGRRVEFEFRVRSCALYAKQQSLPFQFADLEDLPYVSSQIKVSVRVLHCLRQPRSSANYWKQLPIAIQSTGT